LRACEQAICLLLPASGLERQREKLLPGYVTEAIASLLQLQELPTLGDFGGRQIPVSL